MFGGFFWGLEGIFFIFRSIILVYLLRDCKVVGFGWVKGIVVSLGVGVIKRNVWVKLLGRFYGVEVFMGRKGRREVDGSFSGRVIG